MKNCKRLLTTEKWWKKKYCHTPAFSFPPLFHSRVVFLNSHPALFAYFFTGHFLLELNVAKKLPYLMLFLGVESWNWAVNLMITILWPPKLPDSSVHDVVGALLHSKFLLVSWRNLLYFWHDAPHLILPYSRDLDTLCVILCPRKLAHPYMHSGDSCLPLKLFSLCALQQPRFHGTHLHYFQKVKPLHS